MFKRRNEIDSWQKGLEFMGEMRYRTMNLKVLNKKVLFKPIDSME